MSGGFSPKVVYPYGFKIQTQSSALQTPFFFGASQTPSALFVSTGRGLTGTPHSNMVFATKGKTTGCGMYLRKHSKVMLPTKLPFT